MGVSQIKSSEALKEDKNETLFDEFDCFNTKEFTFINNKKPFKLFLSKTKDNKHLILQYKAPDNSKRYNLKMSLENLRKKNEIFKEYQNIEQIYNSLLNCFNKNKVSIIDEVESKMINLKFIIPIPDKNRQNVGIHLKFSTTNTDFIVKSEIYLENNNIQNNDFCYFKGNPLNLKVFGNDLTNSAWGRCLDNTFAVFNTIQEDNTYLIYIRSDNSCSLVIFDLIRQTQISEKKDAHENEIVNVRHYANKKLLRDNILSLSSICCVKLWELRKTHIICIITIKNIYNEDGSYSSLIFFSEILKSELIIISSFKEKNYIKLYDVKNQEFTELKESNDYGTVFVDTFTDKKTLNEYVISGNDKYIKSFDIYNNSLYNKYQNNDSDSRHISAIVFPDGNITKLIEVSYDHNLRIWDFHSGNQLENIHNNSELYGLCLWNSEYILVSCQNSLIKLFDIKKGKYIKDLNGHKNAIVSIKKINIPNIGECLISLSWDKTIKIWRISN